MEISAKEARSKLSSLLNKVEEGGEIVIVRRGKRVARLITAESRLKRLPTLKDFRASVRIKGFSLGAVISREREGARY
jgi:prevent-host-death family protein